MGVQTRTLAASEDSVKNNMSCSLFVGIWQNTEGDIFLSTLLRCTSDKHFTYGSCLNNKGAFFITWCHSVVVITAALHVCLTCSMADCKVLSFV